MRTTYRKEPISSFILTVGTVDAVIGGVDGQWSLMGLGCAVVALAIALRWRLASFRQTESIMEPRSPIRYLPEQSSRPSLPMLMTKKKGG